MITETLYSKFQRSIQRLNLTPGQQLVVALGGGADSQTVLDCLNRFRQNNPQYRYFAIHLDHHFHPDSPAWAKTIKQSVEAYGIAGHFEDLTFAPQSRVSKEAMGRERRYQRLAELTDDNAVILLGQHRNDQIETFLLQLKRGSGPRGLASMAEVQPFVGQRKLVRPLLEVSKNEILAYAHANQLIWIEDDTNYDTQIERNYLRHEVVPQLEQRWPQFGHSVLRSASLCAEQDALLDELLAGRLKQAWVRHAWLGTGLDLTELSGCSEPLQRAAIRYWLSYYTECSRMPTQAQLKEIRQQALYAAIDANVEVCLGSASVYTFDNALWWFQHSAQASVLSASGASLAEPWGCVRWQTRENGKIDKPIELTDVAQLLTSLKSTKLYQPKRQGGKPLRAWLKQSRVPWWLRDTLPVLICAEWLWLPMCGWLTDSATKDNPPLTITVDH
ncbi:tRNA(Ile)-lysidine synthase [Idiomarina fontislapidosi]|uniref:tRNA(Ile)-lysidine synthase n=1 Tax=Idiomarina fontislapidosi TaxID=263723 RepID=A0A432XRS2_9GAMM|nr:tRNA lysidine(34) synthetase TilS [Idiomarina fontislapidosi]PYE31176.1 tRNA(Ile)-lysidine synthase [Idiomarina fontislapidosi]RUO51426.1 tRNA lysidine(34) synthetase TilS [Idiomarina fontislapidosi]